MVPSRRVRTLLVSTLVTLALGGCTVGQLRDRPNQWDTRLTQSAPPLPGEQFNQAPPDEAPAQQRTDNSFYLPGSGTLVREREPIAQASRQADGAIKLNFQDANLLEVVKVILGDMLEATYVVDPKVQGKVSMQTAGALDRDDLIPTLELLLRMNDAALLTDSGFYRVVPLAAAITGVRAPQLGDSGLSLPPGFSVRIVPLRFLGAEDMAQILEPFTANSNQLIRVDTRRNLLVLAASGGDMERLLETIRMFDIDRMRGMSVAMFTPDFVDAPTLAEELEQLLADPEAGLMSGLVRFTVVERLNGLVVVTPRPEYLARVRDWVRRLDRDSGVAGQRLFIYRVQNGKAVELAEILNDLFDQGDDKLPKAEVAPNEKPKTIGKVDKPKSTDKDKPPARPQARQSQAANTPSGSTNNGLALRTDTEVRIIADESNNALLILASTSEYRQILSALQQLDLTPMQVLIEVTIAEVTLTDGLQYGVEWFFNKNFGGNLTGTGTLDLGGGIAGAVPGFSFALTSPGNGAAVLNLLASESNLSIVSSPTLLVLNNQEASIQVGDEVPITTQQQQSTTTGDSNILNSIEYRDTGVLLKVKPRINAGGLVIMEVDQEASNAPNVDDNSLTPRIQTRKITSTVAVNSGDTIILGGLIEDNRNSASSGLPGLHNIPLFGGLFGNKSDNLDRTELLVLITPRAISHRTSALQATEEFRRKMRGLIPPEPEPEPGKAQATDEKSGSGAGAQPSAAAGASATGTVAVQQSHGGPLNCQRIGPFQREEDARAFAAQFDSPDELRTQLQQKPVLIGHRVVIPGDDAQLAQQRLGQLHQEGLTDALLYTAGLSRNDISLGLFSTPENARQHAARVRGMGFDVDVREAMQDRFWLILDGPFDRARLDSLIGNAGGVTQTHPYSCPT